MNKIEKILDNGHRDGEFVTFVDIDLQQQIQKYAEYYAKKCLKIIAEKFDNHLIEYIDLPIHD